MKRLFGTDGIRGKANIYPMTPDIALKVGKAVALVLAQNKKNPRIVIGKDTRLSGYMFEDAIAAGICSMGGSAIYAQVMPTPAIAHLTKSLSADAGIVISASHNPFEDNGIKIFNSKGFKLSDEIEKEIEAYVLGDKIETTEYTAEKVGKAFMIDHATGRYIEFAKNTIANMSLAGLKIILDCANGAAYKVAPLIFKELGAEVIVIGNKPNGMNINLDCGSMHPENLAKHVLEHKADMGIALDGDADRIIVVDEKGNEVDGDHLIALNAIYLKENNKLQDDSVVVTVMSNLGLKKCMKENGITVVETPVGDRAVAAMMRKHKYNLGGEQSGHIIFLDHATTGDGIIAGLQILRIMKKQDKKISELAECMQKFPQILINVEVKEKKDFSELMETKKVIEDVEVALGNEGRVLVRYSGTQNLARVMVEGPTQEIIEKHANQIVDALKKEIGE